ncbi:hypothetical protein [Planctomicrobium sp. SH664]|uniref:hypothetical protein n=1 Tax=Planctomicrobium sp. SH664 TaxID=3448125 RepID=UPI003F5ADF94
MADLNIQLTRRQQELLLRGLRFVRSSVALDMQEWNADVDHQRQSKYTEIEALQSLLNGAKIVEAANV